MQPDFEIGRVRWELLLRRKLLKVQITALSPLPSVSPNIGDYGDDDFGVDDHTDGNADEDNEELIYFFSQAQNLCDRLRNASVSKSSTYPCQSGIIVGHRRITVGN